MVDGLGMESYWYLWSAELNSIVFLYSLVVVGVAVSSLPWLGVWLFGRRLGLSVESTVLGWNLIVIYGMPNLGG